MQRLILIGAAEAVQYWHQPGGVAVAQQQQQQAIAAASYGAAIALQQQQQQALLAGRFLLQTDCVEVGDDDDEYYIQLVEGESTAVGSENVAEGVKKDEMTKEIEGGEDLGVGNEADVKEEDTEKVDIEKLLVEKWHKKKHGYYLLA